MKKFIIKNIIFLIGIAIISSGLLLYKVSTENPYSILFHIKNEKLISHKDQKKVIILGGSNARYGFDSQLLEKKLKKPVINASITHHQGLAYYLDWSKKYLKRGDWVIISPEYSLTETKEGLFGTSKLIDVAYANKHFLPFLLSDFRIIQTQLFQSHGIVISCINNAIYPKGDKGLLLAAHNINGDAINCYGKSKHFTPNHISIVKPAQTYYTLMNKYAAYCKSKGIKLFLAFPPVRKESVTIKVNAESLTQLIRHNLSDFVLVNTPALTIYPDSLFFDSSYHLNTEGKKLHTQTIYATLNKYHVEDEISDIN